MRTYSRPLRVISAVALFFFLWSFGPAYAPIAWAAEKQQQVRSANPSQSPLAKGGSRGVGSTSGERFEKALEAIREKVITADDKVNKGQDVTAEVAEIKKQRTGIESLDAELRKEFSATEKKLKDAKLPKEILDRHYKFVKHYEKNLKELKANLAGIERSAKGTAFKNTIQKTKAHLEKTKPPTKHVPLDPNKLPFRTVKGKERAPRLKKEEFERDFHQQKQKANFTAEIAEDAEKRIASGYGVAAGFSLRKDAAKPIILAFNTIASDVPFQLPRPSGDKHPLPIWGEGRGEGGLSQLSALSESTLNSELGTMNYQVAQATVDLPTAADLAENPDIRFTPELRQIASLLENNPVQLYEFVRNNFSYDPYYGSVKGSQSTLLLQNGNDFDQASVLIALFRVSGIPARYVYGTVEIPIEKAMKWLGGISDPRTVGTVLATNGIPAKLILSGGTIKSVQLEHVWTEVYIPYTNYRGLINDPTASKTWIPLDPSFKLIEPNPDVIDLANAQQFDIDSYMTTYLQTVKSTTPAMDYLKTTKDYVTANISGKTFYDLLVSNTIIDKVLGLLPDTLSYPIRVVGTRFSTIPDNYRHRIILEFTDPNTNESILNYTTTWTTVLHNRFTLSYNPATATDEQIIANYGNIYTTPSYLIKVKPILKVEGVMVATGVAMPMASDLMCRMSFISPDGTIEKVATNNLVAGAIYAIGLGSGYTTGRIVTNRTLVLESAVNENQVGEPIIGEYLNVFAVNYLQELDSSRKLIAKSMKTFDTNRAAELMVGVELGVSSVFGVPKAVDIRGIFIDVDYNTATPANIDDDQTKVRRFQIMTGMTSSALEHNLFEAVIGVEAVSTIKALEIANVQGIPVHQIDANNIAEKLPLLQLSSEVKTDIQNAVNAGKVVTVSERNIQLNNWTGVGYIILDPITGEGAYMISSGLSGGSLTWVTRDLQYLVSTRQWTANKAKQWVLEHKKKIWFYPPVYGPVTSEFGVPRGDHDHSGIDIKVDIGTHVYAVAAGNVTRSYFRDDYGLVVYIDHGGGVETIYGHNSTLIARRDAHVSELEYIADSGSTGTSTGPHVHFEIRVGGVPVNPRDFSFRL